MTATAVQRVLIVDDAWEIGHGLAAVLARHPERLDVTTTARAAEGLALARSGRFDLVVSDYRMPGLSGLDVLKTAREAAPGGRRLLMTALPKLREPPTAILDAAPDAILLKPFEPADAAVVLAQLLAGDAASLAPHRASVYRALVASTATEFDLAQA